MKAELKINYDDEFRKGNAFTISEIKGERITLRGSKKNVDFGLSEVKIIEGTSADLFSLGKYVVWEFGGKNGVFSQKDRDMCVASAIKSGFPTTKNILNKALERFLDATYSKKPLKEVKEHFEEKPKPTNNALALKIAIAKAKIKIAIL